MTIARGRWQEHLKSPATTTTRGARELEDLHGEHPDVGADTAALAHHALAEVLERCRVERLTRHQHVLMRLGELIAQVEGAAALARRAQRAADEAAGSEGFTAPEGRRAGRRQPRERAERRPRGRDRGRPLGRREPTARPGELEQRLDAGSIHRAQAGLLADLDAGHGSGLRPDAAVTEDGRRGVRR